MTNLGINGGTFPGLPHDTQEWYGTYLRDQFVNGHKNTHIQSVTPSFVTAIKNLLHFLKPTGHVMHRQFNIQQPHALPTLHLCVLCLSQNKQRLVPLTA